jgi:hypothetical protein
MSCSGISAQWHPHSFFLLTAVLRQGVGGISDMITIPGETDLQLMSTVEYTAGKRTGSITINPLGRMPIAWRNVWRNVAHPCIGLIGWSGCDRHLRQRWAPPKALPTPSD